MIVRPALIVLMLALASCAPMTMMPQNTNTVVVQNDVYTSEKAAELMLVLERNTTSKIFGFCDKDAAGIYQTHGIRRSGMLEGYSFTLFEATASTGTVFYIVFSGPEDNRIKNFFIREKDSTEYNIVNSEEWDRRTEIEATNFYRLLFRKENDCSEGQLAT